MRSRSSDSSRQSGIHSSGNSATDKFQKTEGVVRRSRAVVDLAKDEIDEMVSGRMAPAHDHPNALIDKE